MQRVEDRTGRRVLCLSSLSLLKLPAAALRPQL